MSKKKFIIVPLLVTALTTTGYTTLKIKTLEKENESLKSAQRENKDTVEYTKSVEEIKEINKRNIDLVVFESDYTKYSLDIDDSRLLGIDASAYTEFKYLVVTDLSKSDITTVKDKIIVHINPKDIQLKEICTKEPKIKYDTNIITSLCGNRITETEKNILDELYEGVEREVDKDYLLNEELFKLNLIDKLERLYDSDNVSVIIN